MRARYPDREGFVERNGARIFYEVYDNDAPTILLMQTWQVVHSRHWKFMIPYLSRHYRVVTYDGVGNGRSDRVTDGARYGGPQCVADAVAVLDATDTKSCVAVGMSMGGGLAVALAGFHPERVDGVVAICAAHPWRVEEGDPPVVTANRPHVAEPGGWELYDPAAWREDWPAFVEFFFDQCVSDRHSTKGWEDAVNWSMETSGELIANAVEDGPTYDLDEFEEKVRAIDVPVLLVQGTDDRVIAPESTAVLAKMIPGSEVQWLDGSGHFPHARYPVRTNHEIRSFADRVFGRPRPDATWHIGPARPKRALMISSPIGLGHARRDVAIADELRVLHPELQIDWLAQHPVTKVLDDKGETIHEASRHLANESAHFEAECGEHDLACFQALRDMDEIHVANFMLIDEVIAAGQYDLVIGDESWELDHHLHENPNLKKTTYAWLTDFVGYLPMPDRGEREAFVATDHNAEMIEQIARYSRIRDEAIFVGNPDDIVLDTFGPGLPAIREWTEDNYRFAGYVTGFDPVALGDRDELRAELGYHPDEPVCIVSVGGSGVGTDLLRRVADAAPAAQRAVDGLRMIVVTGPRIDPASLPQVPGVEYHAYVDRLYRHLAAADLAIVQGGLTTTMELTACKVPFVYVPLRNHFEQNFHVRARLDRYRAGRFMDYDDVVPDHLASVIASDLGATVDYRDVETDGARRAAEMIGQLL